MRKTMKNIPECHENPDNSTKNRWIWFREAFKCTLEEFVWWGNDQSEVILHKTWSSLFAKFKRYGIFRPNLSWKKIYEWCYAIQTYTRKHEFWEKESHEKNTWRLGTKRLSGTNIFWLSSTIITCTKIRMQPIGGL